MPSITLITGAMAAGKSTTAAALAAKLSPSIHLRGDTFRKMIVQGRKDMHAHASSEALAQLRLRYQAAADVAERYYAAGFHVVYQDTIVGPVLDEVIDLYTAPLNIVVLHPSPATIQAREAARDKNAYANFSVAEFYALVDQDTPRHGLWLDNTELTVASAVDCILDQFDFGSTSASSHPHIDR